MLTSKNYKKREFPETELDLDVDFSIGKNLLSPSNTSDQKFLQYIQSLGIQVNLPDGHQQNTLTDSDFKQYVDFQKHC